MLSRNAGRLVPVLIGSLQLLSAARGEEHTLKVRLSWGHTSATPRPFELRFFASNAHILGASAADFEPGDSLKDNACSTTAGGGDVDAIIVDVTWTPSNKPSRKPHEMWAYLLDHGERGQVTRLKDDPGLTPDPPGLTLLTTNDGTAGFTLGLDQLTRQKAMWVPAQDVYITLADDPVAFLEHVRSLKGERVLDRVKKQPEATLADFTSRWEDVGNPDQWKVPWQTRWLGTVGHLVGTVARHGSLYKFGIDRWGNVRPDFASPHKFRLDLLWPGCTWTGQRIVDGLPLIETTLERATQRCKLEQFAAPLSRKMSGKRGEVASVFFTRLQISGEGPFSVGVRLASENKQRHLILRKVQGKFCVVDTETGAIWLMVEPALGLAVREGPLATDAEGPRIEFDCEQEPDSRGTRSVVFKLASPVIPRSGVQELAALDFEHSRSETVKYWEKWLSRGMRLETPEPVVNELFRANLWHALMLPRFREPDRIDLPYSNFAYGQLNADWPINQAVYVDYMLYGLRGYFRVAEEELAAMLRIQQKPDGRIGGYADWGVYSPGMLYAVGQNFLLSEDRASFERLLPASLKALDWCLAEIARGKTSSEAPGLIVAPLNDLTHESRAWAFPNAYFVAGLDVFGRALAVHGHPRAGEVRALATGMRADVERAFATASVRSPIVQLADGTWVNYVPCDAMTPRRLLDVWYPTDVDCGPLHLVRLGAINPRGWLAAALLHDHEDNLFLNQWGAANEPVYNPQGTAYLLRDEPEAAIRTFYSTTASAFSHHQFSPLEHRWAWGQYFCPPSTDGAWFELLRNMLVNELASENALVIGQAIPRRWLANGNHTRLRRVQTHYGPVNIEFNSASTKGRITVKVEFESNRRPEMLIIRLRHPENRALRAVKVNGKTWTQFDPALEWARITHPKAAHFTVEGYF